MKRAYTLALMLLLAIALDSCTDPREVVSEQAIDTRYTPAYEAVETGYKHQYSWGKNEFMLVPDVHTVYHHEKFEVLYLVTYDDGSEQQEWVPVTKSEYLEIDALLTGGSHAPDD